MARPLAIPPVAGAGRVLRLPMVLEGRPSPGGAKMLTSSRKSSVGLCVARGWGSGKALMGGLRRGRGGEEKRERGGSFGFGRAHS